MIEAIETARQKGAEFICIVGHDTPFTPNEAIGFLSRQPEEAFDGLREETENWYESDIDGHRIIRAKGIYGGLTRHESGVIVRNGSDDVFCGNWGSVEGLPGQAGRFGQSHGLVAVLLDPQALDDDTLELACRAARDKGDLIPTLHEVFRIGDTATIITFNGWP